MSNSITGNIYLDPLRDRESVAGAVNGLLRSIETRAKDHGQRVIWSTIEFKTDVDHISSRGITEAIGDEQTIRHLITSVQTVDPKEVSGA